MSDDLHADLDKIEFAIRSVRIMGDSGIRISGSLLSGLKVDMDVAQEVVAVPVVAAVVTPGTGACCHDDTCTIETQADCEGMGGNYVGDDTGCDPDPCACCPFTSITVSMYVGLTGTCGLTLDTSLGEATYTQGIDFTDPNGMFFDMGSGTIITNCTDIRSGLGCEDDPPPDPYPPDCGCSETDAFAAGNVLLICSPGMISLSVGLFAGKGCTCDCQVGLNEGDAFVDILCADLIGTHVISAFGGTCTATVTFA